MELAGWLSDQGPVSAWCSPQGGCSLSSGRPHGPEDPSVLGGLSSLAQVSHPGSGLALSPGLSRFPFGPESK